MIFRQLFHAPSSTYTYLLACERSRKSVLIDPVLDMTEQYLMLVQQLDLKLEFALDTHTHADHITALGALRDASGCATLMGDRSKAACVSDKLIDGEILAIGDLTLKAHYTPGHTDESFSYAVDGRLFTGDVLLIRGSGRTDFQGGDAGKSWDSIQNVLFSYPDQTLICPGHDYKGWTVSSVKEERQHNPRIAGKTKEEYIDIMESLNLPDPKIMDIAVTANLQCGDLS